MSVRVPAEENGRACGKRGLPGRVPGKGMKKARVPALFFVLSCQGDQMTMRRTAMSLSPQ